MPTFNALLKYMIKKATLYIYFTLQMTLWFIYICVCMCSTVKVKQKTQSLFDEFSYSFNT